MKEIIIKEINTRSEEYDQLLYFRNKLLREPLGLNLFDEDLQDDARDIILVVMQEDEIVGCVMLHPKDGQTVKLR